MTEREALHRAILLDPEDLTARRIYADWLLEYGNMLGQEYAAFIQGQLDGRSGFVQTSHWPAQSHAMWAGEPFSRLPWDCARWEWRGGFIEVLDCTTLDFLHHARELFACQPSREVRLRDREPGPRSAVPGDCRTWIVRGRTWHRETPYDIPAGVRLAAVQANAMDEVVRELLLIDDPGDGAHFHLEFEDDPSARQWLSRSCVLYGRQQAGLTDPSPTPLAGPG